MSSSFEKVIKLACKPKAAPPKPKYLDPIIAATWSEDGSVHDVCKALSPRFREPNVIIVFKALIVLHTMIRNGATDNVLGYLSSSDVLRLRNITAGHWEGYNAPQNLQNYAIYLDTRIRAYRDLKHDAIRVQSESNRDMRNSAAIEEDKQHDQQERSRRFGRRRARDSDEANGSMSGPTRSKTIAGRKLRVMTVEKGLLRETKIVQKMIDALVETRFYLDDLEDELNITALRMLVKDLLILFQACNEGVINVLEHYFEMSKIDAKEALDIYRHFCKETERVVEYLGVAKKLQNLLNVPIPNLRHAPVSLAGALEEYLNDPNFEQNRIEYKTNKEIADRNAKNGVKSIPKPAEKVPEPKPEPSNANASSSTEAAKPASSQAMIDFFSAIEEEQQTMFNPQTNSPTSTYFQQQAAHNPFSQQQMMTGQPFAGPQVLVQPTGFMMPQQTGFNPFNQQQQSISQTFAAPVQPQQTGFLMPQATGANPFRQSMLFAQTTGAPGPAFGMQPQPQMQTGSNNPFPPAGFGTQQPSATNPFPAANQAQAQQPSLNPFPAFGGGSSLFSNTSTLSAPGSAPPTNPFPSFNNSQPSVAAPTAQQGFSNAPSNAPPRSASVPLTGGPQDPTPVKSHQTGSRNPFGVPVTAAPPVPKAPTLMELAMGVTTNNQHSASGQQQQFNGPSSPTGLQPSMTGFGSTNGQNGSTMTSIASSFTFQNGAQTSNTPGSQGGTSGPFGSASPSTTGTNSMFSSLQSQPTGATSVSSPTSPLKPQTTGFGGLKAFKPSSSFGAALLESLPPIPQSAPTTPNPDPPKHTPSTSVGGGLNPQPTGFGSGLGSFGGASTVGVGLRPQATGALGAANPFRATMLSLSPGPTGSAFGSGLPSTMTGNAFGGSAGPGLTSTPTGFPGFGTNSNNPMGGFGASASTPSTLNQQQHQQQNGQASLI